MFPSDTEMSDPANLHEAPRRRRGRPSRALAARVLLAALAGFAMPLLLEPAPLSSQPSLLEQGRAALGRGEFDAAIEILEKAVAASPQSAEAHYYLGNAYGAKAEDSGILGKAKYGPKVKGEMEAAVALDPGYIEARMMLAMVYSYAPRWLGGSEDKALDQAMKIKAIDPIVGHRAYALVYTQQKKPELAKQEYLDGVREHPDSPRAHSFLGQYLVNVEHEYTAAFAEFETALKIDPKYMPAYYHLGRAAAQAKANLNRGEEALKKYLAYTPTEKEPTLANAHYFLGAVYESAGKKADAKRSYETALELYPGFKDASKALKRVS